MRWEKRAWVRDSFEKCPRQANSEEAELPVVTLDQAGNSGQQACAWSSTAAAGTLPRFTLVITALLQELPELAGVTLQGPESRAGN